MVVLDDARRCAVVEVVGVLVADELVAERAAWVRLVAEECLVVLDLEGDGFFAVEGSCASTPRLANKASAKATISVRK